MLGEMEENICNALSSSIWKFPPGTSVGEAGLAYRAQLKLLAFSLQCW